MTRPAVLVRNDDLLIRWLPGASRHLVLAFTGIQHGLGGVPLDEFIGSASDNARNHVLFISDLKRMWYSSARLVGEIVNSVKSFITGHKISKVTAIGNSMGGYGAILFAAHLPLSTVIAFAPQISMHPDVLNETRWSTGRPRFGEALPRSLESSIHACSARLFLFFGADSTGDIAQAALLPPTPRIKRFTLLNCGHNVAAFLKSAGLLRPVISNIQESNGAGLGEILQGKLADG